MPAAILGAAVSAIGAAAAGTLTFSALGSILAKAALSFVLSSLTAKLAPKQKAATDAGSFAIQSQNRTQQVRQPITVRRYVYGEVRVSGPVVFAAGTSENKYLHLVIPLASHEVQSIDEVWLGDAVIPSDWLDGAGMVTTGDYSGKVRIKKHLGAPDQTADTDLVSEVTEWTSSHRGRGVAYIYVRLEFDRDLFPTGAPNISAVVRGRKVYDTRASASVWSTNAALLAYDYIRDVRLGCRVAAVDIAIDETDAAANACEEIVDTQNVNIGTGSIDTATDIITLTGANLTLSRGDRVRLVTTGSAPGGLSTGNDYFVIPYQFGGVPRIKLAASFDDAIAGTGVDITSGGSGSHTIRKTGEPRYCGGGTIDADQERGDALYDILSAMGGSVVYTGGYWKLFAAVWRGPSVTLDESHSRAPMRLKTKTSRGSKFNSVKGIYSDPANYWQPADYPVVPDSAAIANDGEESPTDFDQPFTQRPHQAQRIAKIKLRRHRNEETVDYFCNMAGLQFQPTDTLRLNDDYLGYVASIFEVMGWQVLVEDRDGAQVLGVDMQLAATAATDYAWSAAEESAISPVDNVNLPNPFTVTVPMGFSLDSEAIITAQGDFTWKVTADWEAHPNQFVVSGGSFEIFYKKTAEATYKSAGKVDGVTVSMLIPQLAPDTPYDFELFAYNNLGRRSAPTGIYGFIAGTTFTTLVEDWESNTETRDPDNWESDAAASENWEI